MSRGNTSTAGMQETTEREAKDTLDFNGLIEVLTLKADSKKWDGPTEEDAARYSGTLSLLQGICGGRQPSRITKEDEDFVRFLCLSALAYDSDDEFFSEPELPASFSHIEKLREITFHPCWEFQSDRMFSGSIPGPILSMRKKVDRDLIILDHVELAESLSLVASEAANCNEMGFSQRHMLQEIASWGKECIAQMKWRGDEEYSKWESRKQQFTSALELKIDKLHTEIHQKKEMSLEGVEVVITFKGLGF